MWLRAVPPVLRAPVERVGTAAVPTPSGKVRSFALPNAEAIVAAVHASSHLRDALRYCAYAPACHRLRATARA